MITKKYRRNRKIAFIIIIALLIISVAGCNRLHSNDKDSDISDNGKEENNLVWVCDFTFTEGVDQEIFTEFNRILKEKYHFKRKVDFVGINSLEYDDYQKELREKKQQGEPVDILYTGMGKDGANGTYNQAVDDGVLMPISDMLQDTESGKALYKAYDKKFWEIMNYNGEIYGFRPMTDIMFKTSVLANPEYYSGKKKVTSISFDDLGGILKSLDTSGKDMKNVLPVYISSSALCEMEGYIPVYYTYDGIYFKKINNKWQIINATEDDRIKQLWKKIREYETMYDYQGDSSTSNDHYSAGKYCISILPTMMSDYYNGKIMLDDVETDAVELSTTPEYIIYPENAITGIASWSKHPEEALKLLSLIETKKDLSNLLAYGIKGKHYVIKDDKPVKQDNQGNLPGVLSSPANYLITYRNGLEPVSKSEIYKKRNEESPISPQVQYQMKFNNYNSEMYKISNIYNQYSGLWNGEYKDVDKTVAELQQKLKEAGVEELVKKLNKLLPEQQ